MMRRSIAVLLAACGISQVASAPRLFGQTWNDPRSRALVEQATERRARQIADTALASYKAAATLGHGEGYVYPHDAPGGWAPQEYRPPEVADRVYWVPSGHGDDRDRRPEGARPPVDGDEERA